MGTYPAKQRVGSPPWAKAQSKAYTNTSRTGKAKKPKPDGWVAEWAYWVCLIAGHTAVHPCTRCKSIH